MIARDIGEVVRFAALIAVLSLAGVSCGSSAADGASDAGRAADATSDAGIDAEDASAVDVASDVGIDADSASDAADAGADSASDAGTGSSDADGSNCPPNVPCDCVCPPVNEGGVCICDNFSMPQCPAGAGGGTSCSAGSACMGCFENAGFVCDCADAGPPHIPDAAGPWWACVGTEYACMGGGI